MPASRAATEIPLAVCPECKQQSLHVYGRSGEDDHGLLEGDIYECEKCGYMDEWTGRC